MVSGAQQECSIGVDLGTTAIKVIVFASRADVNATHEAGEAQVAIASRPAALRRSAEGAAELDPQAQYTALHEALADAVAQAHSSGYRVARIGISAAMHSLLAVAEDGTPLTPVLTWADLRAENDAEDLWSSPQGPALYARTGTPVHAMTPLSKVLWLRRTRPEVFQRAARFVGLKEWVWYRWFGEWKVDASLASATGFYNLRERRWDAEALAIAGIVERQLSAVAPTEYLRADRLPDALRSIGLDDGCALVIGASDGVLANLGVHATDGKRMVLTLGTSAAVRIGGNQIITDARTRSFCYVLSEQQNLYVLGSPSNSGGAALDWVYDRGSDALVMQAPTPPVSRLSLADALDAARQLSPSSDLYFLPYIAGERAPFWTTRTTGAFIGLRSEHTLIDELRAAVEGILLNARWIAEPLLSQPQPPEAIMASGGALQSEWVRQLAADIFGLPIYEIASVEASAQGAATLADLACGVASWSDVAQPLTPTSVMRPSSATQAIYAHKGAKFRKLAQTLFDLSRESQSSES